MEFVTREIQTNQVGKRIINQFMLDEDFNVPDSKRDVQRIVASEGVVKVDDIKMIENHVKVVGKLEFQVLYVGEGLEASLCCMTGKLPFEEKIYVEESGGIYEVRNSRVELQAMMIHSRKLRMKAMIELEVEAERQTIEVFPVDIESSTPLLKKEREIDLLKLHMSKRDTYRIKEELTLPDSKEDIGTLLWSDVANRKLDTKLVSDELQVFGEFLLFCFYESPDGKLDWIEKNIPYQGKVECYGADETMFHQIQSDLEDVNVEVRMDEDGELRIIGIEGTLKLNIAVYEEEQLDVLEDVYSLEKQCRLEKKEVCYEKLLLQNHSKCKVMQKLSLPELKNDILQICHSSGTLQVDHIEAVKEGVHVEGVLHINFLYVKANDQIPFEMWRGVVPFSHLIECKETDEKTKYQISSILEQLNVNLLGGNEVEVRAGLAFHCFFRKTLKEDMISNLKMETFTKEEVENRPGVIGYIVKEGDDLWSLAKKYHTTMDGIREMNELEGEKLKVGERILIFKENMTIL
jgi:LysM repeat protein